MNVFTRCFLSTRLQPTCSIIRPIRCFRPSPSFYIECQRQSYASFRAKPPPEDEQSAEQRAAELVALKRRADQAKTGAHGAGGNERQLRERYLGESGVFEPDSHFNRPISLRPLFVGLGICVTAFLVAEAIDGRADARVVEILARTGWSGGTMQDAKDIVAANTVSPLTFLDHFLGTHTDRWWNSRTDGTHATVIIIATNAMVFLAWGLASRVPALSSRMMWSFLHFPAVTPSYTLLTSVFSHKVRENSVSRSTLSPLKPQSTQAQIPVLVSPSSRSTSIASGDLPFKIAKNLSLLISD